MTSIFALHVALIKSREPLIKVFGIQTRGVHSSGDALPVTALKEMPRPTQNKCKLVFTGNGYHIGAALQDAGARRVPTAPQGSPRRVSRTTLEPELQGFKAFLHLRSVFL